DECVGASKILRSHTSHLSDDACSRSLCFLVQLYRPLVTLCVNCGTAASPTGSAGPAGVRRRARIAGALARFVVRTVTLPTSQKKPNMAAQLTTPSTTRKIQLGAPWKPQS